MALSSFIKNDRFSTATTKSLAAANAPEFDNSVLAPEYDHTLLAPEYRGENTALEVDPGRGIQVFYDNNYPPEAVEIKSPGSSDAASLPLSNTPPAPKSKKTMLLLLLAIILLVAAMGIGLGVGLGQRGKKAAANLPSSPTLPSNPSTTTISVPFQPSATGRVTNRLLQHGIRDNTSLAAVTLPNGLRHVYFQETSGALRRAVSSSQVGAWGSSDNSRAVSGAKNNTPLAAITRLGGVKDPNVTVFFVNSANNTLACMTWPLTESIPCLVPLPELAVSPDCRQISAQTLFGGQFKPRTSDDNRVLLTYQDPAQNLVIMMGFRNPDKPEGGNDLSWTWKNETAFFNSFFAKGNYVEANTLDERPINPKYHVAATCMCSDWWQDNFFSLTCFLKKDYKSSSLHDGGIVSLGFITNDTSPGQLLRDGGAITIPGPTLAPLGSSDIVFLDSSRQGIAWFNQSKLQIDASQTVPPIPKTPFPFLRIAATYINSTDISGIAYLYHQLSDTILAEEVWDSTSGFWVTNNITIETTSVSGPPPPSPTPPSWLDQQLKEDARAEQSRKSESSKPTPT